MNYFQRIHGKMATTTSETGVGTGYEEVFTRQFTFFLNSDRLATKHLVSRILEKQSIHISRVICEKSVGDGRADVIIELNSEEKVVIENKFDAPLRENQLSKYLEEPATYVLLCSDRTESIPREIRNHNRYFQPTEAKTPNFLWPDIYTLIKNAPSPPEEFQQLRLDFLEYMKNLALAPTDLPDKWPRLFNSSSDGKHKDIQADFGNCLEKALSEFKKRGHSIGTSSRKNKILNPKDEEQSFWERIWIYPTELEMDEVDCDDYRVVNDLTEALAIQFVSFEHNHDEFRELYEQVPRNFDKAPGETWYRMKYLPHSGQDKRKFGMVRSLKPLVQERKELPSKLESVIKPTLDHLLNHVKQ